MAENLSMTKNNKTDELEFQCPLCGQELVAGLDLAGQEIFCPGCEQVINIPEPQPPDLPLVRRLLFASSSKRPPLGH